MEFKFKDQDSTQPDEMKIIESTKSVVQKELFSVQDLKNEILQLDRTIEELRVRRQAAIDTIDEASQALNIQQ